MMKSMLLALALGVAAWAAPARVLIVYHSETGHTAALAEAVRAGAAEVEGVEAVVRKAGEVKDEEFRAATGVLIGTPVHWQTMSAETKRVMDRMAAALGAQFGEGKLGGVFCTSGSASNGADATRMAVIAGLLAMRFVVAGGEIEGGYGSLGAQAYGGVVSEAAKAEARRFGARFARLARRMRQE